MAIQMLRICGVAEVVAVVKPVQTQNDTPYRKNRKTPLRFEQVNRSHRMGFNFACIRSPAIQMLRICGVAEVVAVAKPAQTQQCYALQTKKSLIFYRLRAVIKQRDFLFAYFCVCASSRAISTPITLAIINPLVQPQLSPRQWRFLTEVLR